LFLEVLDQYYSRVNHLTVLVKEVICSSLINRPNSILHGKRSTTTKQPIIMVTNLLFTKKTAT